jgi:tRNA 2-thiouridine synthesizing protein A
MSSLIKNIKLEKINAKRHALDVRGFACPYPQVLVMAAMDELKTNDVLEITLDNPPSVQDVPSALESRGYEVSVVSRIDSLTWKIVALKTKL